MIFRNEFGNVKKKQIKCCFARKNLKKRKFLNLLNEKRLCLLMINNSEKVL